MNKHLKSNVKPGICFVALENFAALTDDPKFGHIGGAERQQVLIGKELAKRGYPVSFITLDHGQEREMEIDGMCIIKAYDRNMGIPVLRFLHPRLTILWRAMSMADADIYYQRTSDSITGIVAAFCRRRRRKFVFAVASNYECVIDLPHFSTRHERILYRYGLRGANLVITQTAMQQKLLCENFGIKSTVIPNCAQDHGCSLGAVYATTPQRGKRLLWVGRFGPSKRLELLLDVAEQNRDLQFDVVGDGNSESEYVQCLQPRAKSLPNVHLHGKVPHAHVPQFYQRAAALICTSRSEGFPNTFLEAWSYGLPIISTFDPDGIIAEHGLGMVAKDVSGLVACIRSLLGPSQQWRKVSHAARQYYLEHHSIDVVMAKFEKVFIDVSRKPISVGSETLQS